jgi:hypothetical protein
MQIGHHDSKVKTVKIQREKDPKARELAVPRAVQGAMQSSKRRVKM